MSPLSQLPNACLNDEWFKPQSYRIRQSGLCTICIDFKYNDGGVAFWPFTFSIGKVYDSQVNPPFVSFLPFGIKFLAFWQNLVNHALPCNEETNFTIFQLLKTIETLKSTAQWIEIVSWNPATWIQILWSNFKQVRSHASFSKKRYVYRFILTN